ncbi:MAG TPA: hypothetical protein VJQ78_07955 [Sphingobium sp.]|nr:hypothetical protein [Sphingobium sp.]
MEQPSPTPSDLLRRLLGRLIPASERYGLPGADDAAIARETAALLETRGVALTRLLAGLMPDDLVAPIAELTAKLRAADAAAFDALVLALTQCYYRDDRVMIALGMEARPPFPKGYAVEEGDWSLLDPVRARGPIWREI